LNRVLCFFFPPRPAWTTILPMYTSHVARMNRHAPSHPVHWLRCSVGLALNLDPPNLHLLSSWDYRHEPLYPAYYYLFLWHLFHE
jgi:hypothetical protein